MQDVALTPWKYQCWWGGKNPNLLLLSSKTKGRKRTSSSSPVSHFCKRSHRSSDTEGSKRLYKELNIFFLFFSFIFYFLFFFVSSVEAWKGFWKVRKCHLQNIAKTSQPKICRCFKEIPVSLSSFCRWKSKSTKKVMPIPASWTQLRFPGIVH